MSASLRTKLRRLALSLFTVVGESTWVLLSFFIVAAVVFSVFVDYVPGMEEFFGTTIGKLLAGGLIYALVVLVVLVPVLGRGKLYVKKLLGIAYGPNSTIWWMPLVAWVGYLASTIVVALATSRLGFFDPDQAQDTGFVGLSEPYEYVVAFIALVVLPPIAEELLFRGYLFGRLRAKFGFWFTTLVASIVFGLIHLQWNVGIDVAVLSVFLCYLREKTGSIWASMVLHALKNGFAYFLLFISPLLGWQLVQ